MKFDVKKVAKLANLPLKKEEEEKFEKQLEATLEHVERLKEIDTSKVPETNEVTNLENVMRDDEVKVSLSQKQVLQNAKSVYNGFFKVKAILEN